MPEPTEWGTPYPQSGPSYMSPEGPIWMRRKGQRVRLFSASGEQVGPEQRNVAPAVAFAISRGWICI